MHKTKNIPAFEEQIALIFLPRLYTADTGHSVSVLIYGGCWISLCVGMKNKCLTHKIAEFGGLNFFSYLEWTDN
jgi:hypothetical protein